MWHLIKKNLIAFFLFLLLVLLIFNVAFTLHNRHIIVTNNALQDQTNEVKSAFEFVFNNSIHLIDIGLRGYALTKNKDLLGPYQIGLATYEANLHKIDSLLAVQGQDTLRNKFSEFRKSMNAYLEHSNKMKIAVEQDSLNEFHRLFNMDKGLELWQEFAPINNKMIRYEDNLIKTAQADYNSALASNVIFQFAMIAIASPMLLFIVFRLRSEEKTRTRLINDFRESNLQYIFNSGITNDNQNSKEIIENSINNLKRVSTFIKEVTYGNYETQWSDLTTANTKLNEQTIVGSLIKMRDEMKRVKEEDGRRLWITDGLAQFSEIVRNNQHSISELTHSVVRFLTNYLAGQQGSLFLLTTEDGIESYLSLSACYAFDKKKFIEKRIEIGNGLVGQVFLEGTTTILTQLPQGYTNIVSGLGGATPNCLVIVPMKYNEQVESVFEFAGFTKLEDYQVHFLEKAGEFVASAIHFVRTTEKTSLLLKQSQDNTQMLRTKEEEMKQNMEELQATQEEMARKEKELNRLVLESQEQEKELNRRLAEIEMMKNENEANRMRLDKEKGKVH